MYCLGVAILVFSSSCHDLWYHKNYSRENQFWGVHFYHDSTTSFAESSMHLQLCELVSQTIIGEALGSVDQAYCEELYQYYLHDFVRSVHRCYHKQQKSENLEYKVDGG